MVDMRMTLPACGSTVPRRMRTRSALAALTAVIACSRRSRRPGAAISYTPCEPAGYQCGTLSVPLDRTGAVPGTVTLSATRVVAAGNPTQDRRRRPRRRPRAGRDPQRAVLRAHRLRGPGHPRPARLRPARHRRVGPPALRRVRAPVDLDRGDGQRLRAGARRRARPVPDGRVGRRPRGAARRVGLRQARARRRVLRHQGRARLRREVPDPRGVDDPRLDGAARGQRPAEPHLAAGRRAGARRRLPRRRVPAHQHHAARRRVAARAAHGQGAAARHGQHAARQDRQGRASARAACSTSSSRAT